MEFYEIYTVLNENTQFYVQIWAVFKMYYYEKLLKYVLWFYFDQWPEFILLKPI